MAIDRITETQDVQTKSEKDDKTLRTFCAFTQTDADGKAEFCIPIPADGRYIAYGDAEFENREFGDYISLIELTDMDRVIAWMMAFEIDSGATEPLADEVVQANGYPDYPVLGHYDERKFPSELPTWTKGTIHGGMAMTFKYGVTEAQPIGGYGFLYQYMCFRIICQKATAAAGQKCQLSVDWAEPTPQVSS